METGNQDFMKCPVCGGLFNPLYLDQVAFHMHKGIDIHETIKGEKVSNSPPADLQQFLKSLNPQPGKDQTF